MTATHTVKAKADVFASSGTRCERLGTRRPVIVILGLS